MPRPLVPTLLVLAMTLVAACSDAATPPPATTPASLASTATTATTAITTTTMPAPATTLTTPPTSRPAPTTVPGTTQPPSTTAAPPTTAGPVAAVYAFPVQPAAAADYGPDHHDYPATDIFAPEGTTLVAVTSGVIDEVSRVDTWDPAVNDPATRGGLYVSIVGDDGVRYYYSHLLIVAAGIDAGARVEAGQVIGAVGRSGNAASTPPHVHFGISPPTFAGDWEVRRGVVSPYPYLRDWEAGGASTPVLP